MRQDDEMNSEQMGEQGGSNWPKFEDADWPVGGEDKPSGWAFTTRRSGIHPNLKPPILQQLNSTSAQNSSWILLLPTFCQNSNAVFAHCMQYKFC